MDEDEFGALFAIQSGDVWRYVRRRCGSGPDADDLTAEVFAVAWRRRLDLPAGDDVRLWLFGTAHLLLANHRRGDGRRQGLLARLKAEPAPSGPTDPARQVAEEDSSMVLAALAALTVTDRDLLLMRAWDGLTVAEIADLLGCTPNAASVRLHKARQRLADALASRTAPGRQTDPGRSRTLRGRDETCEGGPR